MVHDLAHEVCGGRWLLTGGGGYALVQVVPRSWTHLLAIAAGEPVPPERAVPQDWRALAAGRVGEDAPSVMTDGQSAEYSPVDSGFDPGDQLDSLIINTCRAAFPWHGLQPPM
jgi:acetoin utilization protein AcuC